MSSLESLDTSRNHQRTLRTPGTNYFEHAFVTQDNSAPQGLHPEWHAEGAKGGKSSLKNCPALTSFCLFKKIFSAKELPCKGREAAVPRASIRSSTCLHPPPRFFVLLQELRCSTHRKRPNDVLPNISSGNANELDPNSSLLGHHG